MPTVKKQTAKKRAVKKPRRVGSILDRAEPVEFDADEGIKINLYGQSGTGKTTLWSTFPGPILCILCSGSKRPGELRSLGARARQKVKSYRPESPFEVHQIVEAQAEEERFKTVVIDHITGLQDLSVCEVGGLEEAPAQGSWGLLTQQQWGQVALQTKEALRGVLSLSCNVVLIAQERVFNADSTEEMIRPFVASALTPSTVGWLNPAVDYICQMFIQSKTVEKEVAGVGTIAEKIGEVEYCLRVAPHEVFASKFRKPRGDKRPQYITDPSYDKIMKLIRG